MGLNIKIFNNDLPSNIDFSNETIISADLEALGLEIARDPLTLVQLGLQNKSCYIIR